MPKTWDRFIYHVVTILCQKAEIGSSRYFYFMPKCCGLIYHGVTIFVKKLSLVHQAISPLCQRVVDLFIIVLLRTCSLCQKAGIGSSWYFCFMPKSCGLIYHGVTIFCQKAGIYNGRCYNFMLKSCD